MKQFGTSYGGFYLPTNLKGLSKNSIVYCVGVGEDISFDISIAKQTGADVFLFDPTPRAITHVKQVKNAFDANVKPVYNKRLGGGDQNYWNILFSNKVSSNKIHMYNFGVFTKNTNIKFYQPINPDYVSYSISKNMNRSHKFIEIPVKTLSTIMSDLNHKTIDLLKMDIEGVENEVLEQMLDNKIYPKYLCIDFDARRAKKNVTEFNSLIRRLNTLGYAIIKNNDFDISFKLIY